LNKKKVRGLLKFVRICGWIAMMLSVWSGRLDVFIAAITVEASTYLIQVTKYGV